MKACFMGLGYIGLPTAIIAARNNITFVGLNINSSVIDNKNSKNILIYNSL